MHKICLLRVVTRLRVFWMNKSFCVFMNNFTRLPLEHSKQIHKIGIGSKLLKNEILLKY